MEAVIDKIIEIVKEKQLPGIRTIFFGDPITYPEFDLPAIFVAPGTDFVSPYTTGKDKHELRVQIFIAKSARDGYNQITLESPVDRSLIQMADTIVATLRENVTLGGVVAVFQDCRVQYVPAVRGREAVRMAQMETRFILHKSR